MRDGSFHKEWNWMGKPIIIDLAEVEDKYEIMVMYAHDGEEIESKTTKDWHEALGHYASFLRKYPECKKPLTGKYAKLRDDLVKALKAAKEAASGVDDSGTCNRDSAAILLPRWREGLVEQAAKEAGTTAFKWTLYGSTRFVFNPCVPGQANRRSCAAEAMEKALESMGYETLMYYQMD